MRRLTRVLGPIMLALAVTAAALSTQPVGAGTQSSEHALVGSWVVSTDGESAGEPARSGVYTFRGDGTIYVGIESHLTGTSVLEMVRWGEGAWEPVDNTSARYTVSWPTEDDLGISTGTITYDGLLVIGGDGLSFTDDREQSLVTLRDTRGMLVAVYGADPGELTAAVTGERIQVGSR